MPVINTDWKMYHPTTRATDFTTASVGGAATTTEVNQVLAGGVFFDMPSPASGGGTKTQYAKVCFSNTHSTDSATNCKLWFPNALDDVSGNQIVKVVSSSSSDNSSKSVRIVGKSDTGVAQVVSLTLNGTTEVFTTGVLWSAVYRVEVYNGTTPSTATGTLTITHGTTIIGYITAGTYSASGEVYFAMESGIDGTQTIATAAVAPTSTTFYKVRTLGTAISFNGGGTIPAGSYQGVWLKWVITETTNGSSSTIIYPQLEFESV